MGDWLVAGGNNQAPPEICWNGSTVDADGHRKLLLPENKSCVGCRWARFWQALSRVLSLVSGATKPAPGGLCRRYGQAFIAR
jgi:hypothetical protein